MTAILRLEREIYESGTGPGRDPRAPKPAFDSWAYWKAFAADRISTAELRGDMDQAARDRMELAIEGMKRTTPRPTRWKRSAPRDSRQYAPAMATTAARDDRLTPQSKALLQILVARAGRDETTETTKATLGNIVSRSARSVQRYLKELRRFGYIDTEHRKDRRGYDTGLIVRIMEKARPFYRRAEELAAWMMETGRTVITRSEEPRTVSETEQFRGETGLSPKNYLTKNPSLNRALERLERLVMEKTAASPG